ncbi:MAG: pyruvate:ferredoxin (flavodoxin) oxidoreductase, partial [Prevotella sp.]|nr:pyruvate:ferredoxin (flavodoxin) oxidoreductase [Prevotella sp.]
MVLANKKMRNRIAELLKEIIATEEAPAEYKAAAQEWIDGKDDADASKAAAAKLKPFIAAGAEKGCPTCAQLKELEHYLVKRSQWIIGGDGASYDIGYGGLDHVIASGEDVNIFVIDTEVYSNTGGQASKATPIAAVAQFAAAGKRMGKKDLGLMQATYGNVYVAQVAMGADQAQCLKAFREAEAWNGPSLVIAYAPCINHGLKAKGGMGKSQAEEEKAVKCGYWHLWRYNPALAEEGQNPFQLDSKEPNWDDFQAFLDGEVRFLSVRKACPEEADALYAATKAAAKRRYNSYVRMQAMDWSNEGK